MVCVIARESTQWNRPFFKAPRLDLKPIQSKGAGVGSSGTRSVSGLRP